MTEEILVNCAAGHVYELTNFTPPAECIACISQCILEVPHAPAGLIYACGERVVWQRHSPLDKQKKRIRFRKDTQLDLFDDTPLDKATVE